MNKLLVKEVSLLLGGNSIIIQIYINFIRLGYFEVTFPNWTIKNIKKIFLYSDEYTSDKISDDGLLSFSTWLNIKQCLEYIETNWNDPERSSEFED